MSYWQLVFSQSKLNRGAYREDPAAVYNWVWPQETWFQKRLRYWRDQHHRRMRTIGPRTADLMRASGR